MSGELQHRDEFEKMLQSEAESFSLEPSEGVWRKVKNVLHPRSRGRMMPWLWLPLLLALTGAGGYLAFRALTGKHEPFTPLVKTGISHGSARSFTTAVPAPVPQTDTTTGMIKRNSSANRPQTAAAVSRNAAHPAGSRVAGQHDRNLTALGSGEPPSRIIPDSLASGSGQSASQTNLHPTASGHLPGKDIAATPARTDSVKNGNFSETSLPHSRPTDSLLKTGMEKDTVLPASRKKHGLRWEADYTPSLAYRFLHLPGGSGMDPRTLDHAPVYGFSAGILAARHLKGNWSLSAGLEMTRMGYTINARKTYPAYVNGNGSGSFAQPNSFFMLTSAANSSLFAAARSQDNLYNSYLYAGIPLLAGYRLEFRSHWWLDLTAGAGIDYLAVKKINILSPTGRYFTDDSRIRRWNSLLRINPSVGIPLGHRFSLHAGPDFHYQLLSSFKKYDVKEHPWSAGLRVGIGIK